MIQHLKDQISGIMSLVKTEKRSSSTQSKDYFVFMDDFEKTITLSRKQAETALEKLIEQLKEIE